MQADRNAHRRWPILVLALCAIAIRATATRLRTVKPQLSVPAAVAKNSPNPSSLLAEADHFSSLFNWPAAHPRYERAEESFDRLGDRRNAAYARIGRLRAEFGTRSYEDVARDLERELRTSVVDNDPHLKLWALAAKGYTDIEINAPTAKHDWEQVLTLARQLSDKKWISRAQGELGIITFLGGDWKRGAWLVGKAYFETSSGGDIGSEIRYLQFIGAGLNEVNRQSEALYLFDRAIELARDTPGAGFPYMAYGVKAQALTTLGKSVQAKALLEETLAQGRAAHRLDTEAQVQTQLGEVELKLGDQKNGVRDLEVAGALAQRYGFHRITAEAMFDLYGAYRQAGDLSRAEQCVRDGLAASAQIGDRYYLPRDLNALAELEALQGRATEAEASYRRAEAIVEGMLRRAPGRYAEASLLSAVAEIYAGHFRVAAAQGDTDEAYRVLERIRGRSTVDMLLRRPTGGSVGCQDSTYEEKIAAVQVQLMQTADRDRRSALLNELLEAEVELDYHCELDYGAGNLRIEPASLEQLRRVLRPDELLLEYVLNNNASFCLRVTREGAGIVTLPASSNLLDNLVKTYLANVESGRNTKAEAKELYHVLLQKALGSGEKLRLVISADGALSFVPFEALVRADGRHTLSDHIVSYVPSGTFLWLVRTAPRAQAPRRFLGIGGVAYTQVASSTAGRTLYRGLYDLAEVLHLEDLPSTGDEVLAAAHALGDESHVLLGDRATETTFKSEPLKDFEVIHLAVHAIEDPRFPERAGLVLGRDADSKDDGLLQLREIANLRLNANLVVLSACGAARGKIEGEEGVENLVRVFLAAGARAVIASLWNADDDYTAALMKHFYDHLAGGEDAASSLRLAKLEMLSTFGNQAEPYYWAGFTLTGDGVQWLPRRN